ncbi:NAD(P)/FAD-dependent oxidoreductase [Aureispira anguillae]|uniref:FAD-binding protein n=1 Tax=Aureispira anguillae TaxID=2864201 RepID=A0A915YDH3_9BACT|nr:FAD-binding protein [Aureispira anguillae]BDS11068.1 FAD-binding protein [Aureispira anguillae]
MIKRIEIALSPKDAQSKQAIEHLVKQKLTLQINEQLTDIIPVRRSIDARSRIPVIRLLVDVYINEAYLPKPKIVPQYPAVHQAKKVIIVGAGPAGYFAALQLIELGLQPIIFDRGKDVRERRRDLKAIQQEGLVNPDSNYCFGEGGAGTYSDGKLYTRSKKRGKIEKVLRLLVEHGATSDILVDAHPHIGSNKLPKVVANIRETILKHGGQIHFNSTVTDFIVEQKNSGERQLTGVVVNHKKEYFAAATILATGHSARDIYTLLYSKKIRLEAKPFALGVRIEHPQALIDKIQYRQPKRDQHLPAASYSVVCQVQKRGVFSFCMCPGGLIVPAATAPNELVVNGMSLSRRDSPFSNSGLVVAIELEDLTAYNSKKFQGIQDPLFNGLKFQQEVEQTMFKAGDGSQKAPAQRVIDFTKGKLSTNLPATSYIPGIYSARMDQLLPNWVAKRLQKALPEFNKKKKGYFTNEAQIIGTESRTSSPIRIPRNSETLMHPDVTGLYPCGEGAGYAGGIVSAAMDGENVAKMIANFLS